MGECAHVRAWLRPSRQTSLTEGQVETLEFKRYFFDAAGQRISPWHDVPLQPAGATDDVFNFICEIPKGCVRMCAPVGEGASVSLLWG
jgi:hypothetical protein